MAVANSCGYHLQNYSGIGNRLANQFPFTALNFKRPWCGVILVLRGLGYVRRIRVCRQGRAIILNACPRPRPFEVRMRGCI